ncbi:MAG: HD domain-containing protein [Defluviitaleaceae bacterium]|nr:HD domain-containing protein [Defluviitaleaceae bacterium]
MKIDLNSITRKSVHDYNNCVEDLLCTKEIQALADFNQHLKTTRLDHSINVSYYSYVMAKKLNLDYVSAARAGLLHDLFFYDWKIYKKSKFSHAMDHPTQALENAKKITKLNEIEEDAIENHMWPVSKKTPIFKESHIVSMVDKYCACLEFAGQGLKMIFS